MTEPEVLPPGEWELVGPKVSTDGNNGVVSLIIYTYPRGVAEPSRLCIKLGAIEAGRLAADLASHANYEAASLLDQALVGECARCSNTRLVEVQGPGKSTKRERCPDCAGKYNSVRAGRGPHLVRIGSRDLEAFR